MRRTCPVCMCLAARVSIWCTWCLASLALVAQGKIEFQRESAEVFALPQGYFKSHPAVGSRRVKSLSRFTVLNVKLFRGPFTTARAETLFPSALSNSSGRCPLSRSSLINLLINAINFPPFFLHFLINY